MELLRGQANAWEDLEPMRELLRRVLGRHCRDDNEVDDVVQETFVRAARYRSNLRSGGRLRGWIIRIAMNVLSDSHRRRGRMQCAAPGDGVLEGLEAMPELFHDRPEDGGSAELRLGAWTLDREAALGELARALEELRREDRDVLSTFYGGSGRCSETGEACEIPAHLVKIRLFRARRRLLRLLRHRFALCGRHVGARRLPA